MLEAYLATLLSEFQDHVDLTTISSDSDSSESSDGSKSDDDQLTPYMFKSRMLVETNSIL